MRLLFDQNISPKILKHFEHAEDFKHVRFEGLMDVDDKIIFDFAKKKNFTIITLDADFIDLNEIHGCPPKIIWLRTGNRATIATVSILKENWGIIENFLNSEIEVLEIKK